MDVTQEVNPELERVVGAFLKVLLPYFGQLPIRAKSIVLAKIDVSVILLVQISLEKSKAQMKKPNPVALLADVWLGVVARNNRKSYVCSQ